MVERAGIVLPAMYLLGYNNNNCRCCVKGGEGYFNRQRIDFPDNFVALADVQEAIGPGAYLFRDRKTGERYSLRKLPPDKGRHDEPEISCSFNWGIIYMIALDKYGAISYYKSMKTPISKSQTSELMAGITIVIDFDDLAASRIEY